MLLFEFVHFSSYISGNGMSKSMTEIGLLRFLAQRAGMGPAGETAWGRAAEKCRGEALRRRVAETGAWVAVAKMRT